MNNKVQSVLDKINKLRVLAKNNTSPQEAEAAAKAAEKLIAEFQVSEAELAAANPQAVSINLSGAPLYETSRKTAWKDFLAWQLAKLNGCFCLVWYERPRQSKKRGKSVYRVYGTNEDIQLTLYVFNFCVEEIGRMADMFAPSLHRGVDTYRANFCAGMAKGIVDKMEEQRQETFRQASSTAMVWLGNKSGAAEDAWKKANPKEAEKMTNDNYRSGITRDEYAFSAGYETGKDVEINKALGSKQEPRDIARPAGFFKR